MEGVNTNEYILYGIFIGISFCIYEFCMKNTCPHCHTRVFHPPFIKKESEIRFTFRFNRDRVEHTAQKQKAAYYNNVFSCSTCDKNYIIQTNNIGLYVDIDEPFHIKICETCNGKGECVKLEINFDSIKDRLIYSDLNLKQIASMSLPEKKYIKCEDCDSRGWVK